MRIAFKRFISIDKKDRTYSIYVCIYVHKSVYMLKCRMLLFVRNLPLQCCYNDFKVRYET